jgi:hypothetical protein
MPLALPGNTFTNESTRKDPKCPHFPEFVFHKQILADAAPKAPSVASPVVMPTKVPVVVVDALPQHTPLAKGPISPG